MPDEITRQDLMERLVKLEQGYEFMRGQHNQIKRAIDDNTRVTNEIKSSVSSILEIFTTAKQGASLIMWVVRIIKWIGGISMAVAAIWILYVAIKTGQVPGSITRLHP